MSRHPAWPSPPRSSRIPVSDGDFAKRSYGWSRTELTTLPEPETWCGHGVFAHNPVKISAPAR